jgi:hypothetical protein
VDLQQYTVMTSGILACLSAWVVFHSSSLSIFEL